MTKVHLFKWLVAVGLVLGLSSCGNIVNKPAVEEPGLETQEIFDATVFVSTLEVSNGSASRTKKCADVPRSTKRVGADLIQYDCNNQENQLFLFELVDGEDLYFTVKSLASGLCMSVSPTKKLGGNPVVEQTACTGAPNQQFGIIPVSVEDIGYFGIEAGRDSERCLAVKDKSPQNRAPLVTVDCAFDSDLAVARGNRWNLSNYDPAFTTEMIYRITGKCADVPRSSKREGTNLIVYRCNGQTNQQFEFFKVGSGKAINSEDFFIKGVDSGLCVTLSGTFAADNEVIEQRACTGEADQRFNLTLLSGVDVLLAIDSPLYDCLAAEPEPEPDPFPELRSDRSLAQDYDYLVPAVCDSPQRGYAAWTLPGAKDAIIASF